MNSIFKKDFALKQFEFCILRDNSLIFLYETVPPISNYDNSINCRI